jgi:hypothetical protein
MSKDRRDPEAKTASLTPDSTEATTSTSKRRSSSGRLKQPMDPAVKAAVRVGKLHRKKYAPSREQAKRMLKAYGAAIVPRRKPGVDAYAVTVLGTEVYRRCLDEYVRVRPNTPWNRYRDKFVWPAVYRATIPGYDQMDLANGQYHSTRVRSNVKAYLKRRGVKLHPGKRNRRGSRPGN